MGDNMENKDLWKRAFTTDPRAVKPITGKQYKGNSPKPYWIVERLTDEFGPCGIGWGFTILNERMERLTETDILHVAVLRFWYVLEDKRGEFEQIGQTKAMYMTFPKKQDGTPAEPRLLVDEDAPKKSVTDALVKCASYLGFAGDIFAGMWDDSKYVQWAGEEWDRRYQTENEPVIDERTAELNELSLYLIDCHESGKDMDAIRVWYDASTWSADNPTEQEERKYVWGQLREFSKLRSTIKANSPHREQQTNAA
jgi:hypothetical protein